jgi:hypothetical protein
VLGYPLFALTDAQQQAALAAYAAKRPAASHTAPAPGPPPCRAARTATTRNSSNWPATAGRLAGDGGQGLLRLARRDRLRGLFRILTPEAALAEA